MFGVKKLLLSLIFFSIFQIAHAQNEFITIWQTDSTGVSNDNQIIIPAYGNYSIYWEEVDNSSNNGSTTAINSETLTFPNPGTYRVKITGGITHIRFSTNPIDNEKIIDVEQWGNTPWVTMEKAFLGCTNLNISATDAPDLSGVTNMKGMFQSCTNFNGDISSWDVSNVTNMQLMFFSCDVFNQDIGEWTVDNVTDMSFMFVEAKAFNQNINDWNVENVTTMADMFRDADAFNSSLNDWNVRNVTNMKGMFVGTNLFNQDINNWNVSAVTNMASMFRDNSVFNQNMTSWVVTNVTSMKDMFLGATAFDQDLGDWDISNVSNMENMLSSSGMSVTNYDNTLIGWSVQAVQPNITLGASGLNYCAGNMARGILTGSGNSWTFIGDFYTPLCGFTTTWKTDNPGPSNDNQITIPGIGSYEIYWEEVGNTGINDIILATGTHTITLPNPGIFKVILSGNLNQIKFDNGGDRQKLLTIEDWGTIEWTSMNSAFEGCTNLVYNATNSPDLSNVINCAETFRFCPSFNGAIGNWDVSNVTTMFEMLAGTSFNQDLSNWTLTSLTNMNGLFKNASDFNQNINSWNVSNVTNMKNLFKGASDYNQSLSAWNTGAVSNMSSMFENATSFNQSLGDWDISQVTQMDNMLDSSGLSEMHYDSTLISWSSQSVKPNVQLGAADLYFCESAVERADLLDNDNWTIIGDQFNFECSFTTTWKTDNGGPSNDNQITIPGTGIYNIYWEKVDNVDINGTGTLSGTATITFPSPGTYRVGISGGLTQIRFDNGGDKSKILTIENWGNIAWTSMNSAFEGCGKMTYTATDTPDLSGVTDCSQMFRHCNFFNGAIGNWEVSTITNMSGMFEGNQNTSQFNQPLDLWDVSNVTDMSSMFSYTLKFNQNINNWIVSNVTDMSFMFGGTDKFNQPLNGWTVSNVTDMSFMFTENLDFNQPLNNWDVSNVTDMSSMFADAGAFNQSIGNWNISEVTNMSLMLSVTNLSIARYDSTLIGWAGQTVQPNINLGANGLEFCESKSVRDSLINVLGWMITGDNLEIACSNNFITTWKTDNGGSSNDNQITIPGTGTYFVQWEKIDNPNIKGSRNGTGTTTITFPNPGTYRVAISGGLTQIRFDNGGDKSKLLTIENWGNIAWTSMNSAFEGCGKMTYTATDAPDLSGVTDCSQMFRHCNLFNGAIGNWEVSTITNMSGMFEGNQNTSQFNQPLDLWDVSNVTNMSSMFSYTLKFNQNINNWIVSNVTDMSFMFGGTDKFNQPLNSWTVSNVTDMNNMFSENLNFNQPLNNWDVSNVTDMSSMFEGASAFNKSIGNWNISAVTNMSSMLSVTNLSITNYDSTFIGWAAQSVQPNVQLGAIGLEYCEGKIARDSLINIHGWSIIGDQESQKCGDFITTWQTDSLGTSNDNQIIIPGTGNYSVHWEKVDNANINGTATLSGIDTLTFPNAGLFRVSISGGLTQIQFDDGGDKEKLMTIERWGDIVWTTMNGAFEGCKNMTCIAPDEIDLSLVSECQQTFKGCTLFDGNICNWDVSNVQYFNEMFKDAPVFNQDISNWNMEVAIVTTKMFDGALAFNQPIGNWSYENAADLNFMFRNARSFNQDLSNWETGGVNTMISTFENAIAFDQDLSTWDIESVTNMSNMLDSCNLSLSNYDATLDGWESQNINPNVHLGAIGLKYCASDNARDSLINVHGWMINGDNTGNNCSTNFITTWKTDNIGTSNDNQIIIPGLGTYFVQWEKIDSVHINGSITLTGTDTLSFPSPGTYRVNISGGLTQLQFNYANDRQKLLTIENWGNIKWASMNGAFYGCENLTYNATDIPDLSLVTDCSYMFNVCKNFNGAIGNWDVSTVTDMNFMFSEASVFNQDLNLWNVSNVTDMHDMFSQAEKFNGNIEDWNVEKVTDMSYMFDSAEDFNQNIGGWTVTAVTNMEGMFNGAEGFNFYIGDWNVSNVTSMTDMFLAALTFNQDLRNWNVASVTEMEAMFENASAFNQNLGHWNIANVTNMSRMLDNVNLSRINYDSTLISWAGQMVQPNVPLDAIGLEYCSGETARNTLLGNGWTINGDTKKCPFITTWQTDNPGTSNDNQIFIPATGNYDIAWEEVGNPTNSGTSAASGNHTLTFPNAGTYQVSISGGLTQIQFNYSDDRQKILTIENWGDIVWTSMNSAFQGCSNLTYNTADAPDLSIVTDCSAMFQNCSIFNGAIGNWEVSNVTNMSSMFESAYLFNQDISSWIVSNVTDMSDMFNIADDFNMPIGNWDVSKVTDMSYMFQDAIDFNQNIENWVVTSATDMEAMFSHASDFNQNIGNWNVANVTNMADMFLSAAAFNQDLQNWNVSKVTTMEAMFANASAFDQNLGNWNIAMTQNLTDMLSDSDLSKINYDSTLIGWAAQTVQPNLELDADGLEYCDGETARNNLTGNGWTINGDTKNCQSISLSAKILLEGALLNVSDIPGTMTDDLRSGGIIPTSSPYADGLSCNSNVFNTTGSDAIVDWIYLELRDSTDHTIIIDSRSALLQRDGDIVEVDGTSPVTFDHDSGNYFLVAGHRNHLAIMSASTINFSTSNTSYDFTNSLSAIYGGTNSVADLSVGLGLFAGDVNDNGQVQNTDATILIPNLGSAGYFNADTDLNGQVQNAELNNLLTPNIGKGEQF